MRIGISERGKIRNRNLGLEIWKQIFGKTNEKLEKSTESYLR